MLDKINSNTTN